MREFADCKTKKSGGTFRNQILRCFRDASQIIKNYYENIIEWRRNLNEKVFFNPVYCYPFF